MAMTDQVRTIVGTSRPPDEHLPSRTSDHFALLEQAIITIHDERRPREALRAAVRLITDYNGWRVGHVYLARGRPPAAVPTRIWYENGATLHPSVRGALREAGRTAGAHVASRVLQDQQPLWLEQPQSEPYLTSLEAYGLHAVALFPVMTPARSVAVLEFLAEGTTRPDREFMQVMRAVGIQLGYLLERNSLLHRIARLTVQQQQRITMELHDTVGQEATVLGILARMLQQDLEGRSAESTEMVGRLLEGVQRLKQRIRDFVFANRPIDVDTGTLKAELEQLAERYARLGDCACTVDVDESIEVSDSFAATKIARIAREAVHNAVKHGDPRRVHVALRRRGEDQVELEIVDDGKGADAATLASGGLGQAIMRYRADMLSADLEVAPIPQGGVRVRCVIPNDSLDAGGEEET